MERVRIGAAAKRLGVHADTVRRYADSGRLPFVWVGGQRRFAIADLDALADHDPPRGEGREALYVRVSGSGGGETSLAGQERELREAARGPVVAVYRDRASGLREHRPGLDRLLGAAGEGRFEVVRVTHEDRLGRFGGGWLRRLLERDGVRVEVQHEKGTGGGREELLEDFMVLVGAFAGRLYGIRSRELRGRLLEVARERNGARG